jgi:hypothetical protein
LPSNEFCHIGQKYETAWLLVNANAGLRLFHFIRLSVTFEPDLTAAVLAVNRDVLGVTQLAKEWIFTAHPLRYRPR